MNGTINQLGNIGFVKGSEEEEDCQHSISSIGSAYMITQHNATKDPLLGHGLYNPSSVCENPTRNRLTLSSPSHHSEPSQGSVNHRENYKLSALVALLNTSAKKKDLHTGTRVHDDIVENGFLNQCADALVTMYAKCGALEKAKELLDKHKVTNVSAYTALITGFTRNGQGKEALKCFDDMQHEGLTPDAVTFGCILKACGSIKAVDKAEQIHLEIARQGLLENDVVLGNALIDMYVKCSNLKKAQQVLDELPCRDVISWSTIIAGYAQLGQSEVALRSLEQMQHEGLSPNAVTFACALKACGAIRAIEKGEEIHHQIAKQGLLRDNIMLGNSLVDMYAKCSALVKARQVLEELPSRDAISWNVLITGYVQHGQCEHALLCLERMQHEGVSPDAVTFICILKACGLAGAFDKGKQLHDKIVRQGLLRDNIVLGTALVDMYAKCGALEKAQQVLEELSSRDVVSWNALITGYLQQGQGEQALKCLNSMLRDGLSPDAATFACILNICGAVGALDEGERIHDEILKQGLLENNVLLGNALLDMYAKCGALAKAQEVLEKLALRDVISWSALISGYIQDGQGEQALFCFQQMQDEGLSPNAITFTCVLKACAIIGAVDRGQQIHEKIIREGLLGNNNVLGNALVDMYAKCGALVRAHQVLEELSSRDVVSWNALIAGYSQKSEGEEALYCLEQMRHDGLTPDAATFTCILKTCGTIGAVDKGEQFHDEIARQGLLANDVVLGTALVDMYAKCGFLSKAQHVFGELPCHDVASWNALITGYAQEGRGEHVLNCFSLLQQEGLSPNAVTFFGVLNTCSHLGLVEDGPMYFMSMNTKYGIKPTIEHYTCIVDLFGRAGCVDKAVRVILEMPYSDCSPVWGTLLSGCHKWGDIKVGVWAFEQAVQIDKNDAAAYVLMANICAACERLSNALRP